MAKKVAKAKRKAAKSSKAAKGTAGAKDDKIQQEAKKAAAEKDDDADEADEAADEDAEEEDEEQDEEDEEAMGAAKKTKARRLEQALAKVGDDGPEEPKGVIYLGHIPKGFAEPQMRKFFSQFGKVTRLRLSRSKKNAGSKGYAFVEFEEESVAQIVADTMHKYLMFGKQLVCHLMPKDKQHPALFKDWKRRMINFSNARRRKAREAHNNRPTVEVDGDVLPQVTLRQATRRRKASKKLKDVLQRLEVDYDPSLVDDDGAGQEDGVISGAADQPRAGARGKKQRRASDGAEEGAAEPSRAAEEPSKAAKAAGKKPKKKRKAA